MVSLALPALSKSSLRKRRRLIGRRILFWLLTGVAFLYALCLFSLVLLRSYDPVITMVQAQRRLEAMLDGREYEHRSRPVAFEGMPAHFRYAVIAAEDVSFYRHSGVDWGELRLIWEETLLEGKSLRGGSTISQQLVKNLFLTTHRSLLRKVPELALVPAAELVLSKDRILELYLNNIEWGPGVWGAEAAAQYHYGVSVRSLSREQAARLAACIPAPSRRRPEDMNEYSQIILERMERFGW